MIVYYSVLVFYLCLKVTAACHSQTLYASSGVIACPSHSGDYEHNLDVRWAIRVSGTVRIRFSKLEVEQTHDPVYLYENKTDFKPNYVADFELFNSEATNSEFWLSAPAVVRFKTDASVAKAGFRLRYTTLSVSIPVATEVIRQQSGERRSATVSGKYRNNYRTAWSIEVPPKSELQVQFTQFETEPKYDHLKIFPGLVPHMETRETHEISGSQTNRSLLIRFKRSVTLAFRTDGSVVKAGVSFVFNISRLNDGILTTAAPIRHATTSRDETTRTELVEPNNVRIDFLNPELWPLTGVMQFRALSMNSCPNVTHRCELAMRNSSSSIVAVPLKREISGIIVPTSVCLVSVTSQFSVVAELPLIARSVLKCRLRNGRYFSVRMPLLNWAHEVQWKFYNWSDKLRRRFQVIFTPALKQTTWASCRMYSDYVSGFTALKKTVFRSYSRTPSTVFSFLERPAERIAQHCVRNITCEFTAEGFRRVTKSMEPPPAVPESVKVEPLHPELWSLTGLVSFRAISECTCRNMQHNCELRLARGDKLGAMLVERKTSEPTCTSLLSCSIVVTSQFSVVARQSDISGSVIACQILNGSYFKYVLPPTNITGENGLAVSDWSGRSASRLRIRLSLNAATNSPLSATCRLRHECRGGSSTLHLTSVPHQKSSQLLSLFESNRLVIGGANGVCVRNVTICEFSNAGIPGVQSKSFTLPSAYPESVRIQPIQPQLWSQTGLVYFSALSEAACPSVRHRCELRTSSGESLTARQVKLIVSEPAGLQCLSTVASDFFVDAPPSLVVGSEIKCHLLNGSSALYQLSHLKIEKLRASASERPLIWILSVTVTLAAIALTAVLILLFKSLRWIQLKKANDSKREPVGLLPTNHFYANESANTETLDDKVDTTGVYVS